MPGLNLKDDVSRGSFESVPGSLVQGAGLEIGARDLEKSEASVFGSCSWPEVLAATLC